MSTRRYCNELLEQVEAAGQDPQLAYLVRTRLRRAILALERGRSDAPGGGLLADAPPEIKDLSRDLATKVVWLCQPSEALDVRWKREWHSVLDDVSRLRDWVAQAATS
jgi:hypothetical protein